MVYVVDDDASATRTLCRVLTGHGYRAMSFGSAEEFLCTVDLDVAPACLVLELSLPKMGGLSLLRTTADFLPSIMLAARPNVASAVAALSAGAVDFLVKPVPDQQLLAAVGEALERAAERFREREELAVLRNKMQLLTAREREVMVLIADGLRNKAVADRLGTVETTIKVHRARLMQKLELDSLPALVRVVDRLRMSCEGLVL
jgi:FixJ family two-component response regulator